MDLLSQKLAVSSSGKKITLLSEVNRSSELDPSLPSKCDGIGIFSSEELYLKNTCLPDEELLFERYRKAAELMPTKPVTIRSFHTSADVRISKIISEKDGEKVGELYVFRDRSLRTQLRALMSASLCYCIERKILGHFQLRTHDR